MWQFTLKNTKSIGITDVLCAIKRLKRPLKQVNYLRKNISAECRVQSTRAGKDVAETAKNKDWFRIIVKVVFLQPPGKRPGRLI